MPALPPVTARQPHASPTPAPSQPCPPGQVSLFLCVVMSANIAPHLHAQYQNQGTVRLPRDLYLKSYHEVWPPRGLYRLGHGGGQARGGQAMGRGSSACAGRGNDPHGSSAVRCVSLYGFWQAPPTLGALDGEHFVGAWEHLMGST